MPPTDPSEIRSQELELIRAKLRTYLDKCQRMKGKYDFHIAYDAVVFLSPSEEKALIRQLEASHGDDFVVSVAFLLKRRRRNPATTTVVLKAKRRQRKPSRRE